jgi:hypothetical protein
METYILLCLSMALNGFLYYHLTNVENNFQHSVDCLFEIARGEATVIYNHEEKSITICHKD